MKLEPLSMKEADEFLDKSGILYAINAIMLHPLGYALALEFPDGAYDQEKKEWVAEIEPTTLRLYRTENSKAYSFGLDEEQALRAKLRAFLDKHPSISSLNLLRILLHSYT